MKDIFNQIVILRGVIRLSVCRKSRFWNFKPKVFWSSNFSKMLAKSKGRAFGRSPQ